MNRAPTPTVATATTAAAAACSYTLTSAPVDRSANAADGATDDNHPQRPHRNLLAFGFGLNVFQWQWGVAAAGSARLLSDRGLRRSGPMSSPPTPTNAPR
jgi:hypothetical protein